MVKNYPIDPFNDLLNRFIHEILTDLSVANLLELARHVQSAGKVELQPSCICLRELVLTVSCSWWNLSQDNTCSEKGICVKQKNRLATLLEDVKSSETTLLHSWLDNCYSAWRCNRLRNCSFALVIWRELRFYFFLIRKFESRIWSRQSVTDQRICEGVIKTVMGLGIIIGTQLNFLILHRETSRSIKELPYWRKSVAAEFC